MTRLETALEQIKVVRQYSERILEDVAESDWFRQPTEGVTHIAWQVGHMAIAAYRLGLAQVRGELAEDQLLIPADYVKLFGRGSIPSPDASAYPTPASIRAVFEAVHAQIFRELPSFPDAKLDLPPEHAHPLFDTKLGALMWCGRHEMLHVGQIGLLKRLFGAPIKW